MRNVVDDRRRELTASLATRMSSVRGEMTDAEFAQLLGDMVRMTERFAEIEDRPGALAPDMPEGAIRRLLDVKLE